MRKKDVSNDSSQDIKELVTEVRALTLEIHDLKKKLDESSTSLNRCHERLDELLSTQKSTDARLKVLEQRDEEFVLLQNRVNELECTINMQAQTHLKNEVEIIGIPETSNENLQHTILLAARKMGVELSEQDVDWVQRVGPRRAVAPENNFARPVVVRLLRRAKRDQILKASKSRRNITSNDLDVEGPARKIFYNERLTKENRRLFREARETSTRAGYKFCWCHQGTIYMRRKEGTAAVPIRKKEDLHKILPQTSTPDDTEGASRATTPEN
ncbi:uncharacterized protein LOC134755021 [Cydia strobilella]|uniref:uncharacterized protein LOC134755021 n=1 Tax=Cydia strobilella TaxID=1100964 RepID=UPI003006F515